MMAASENEYVFTALKTALENIRTKPDIATITTVSSLEKPIPQIKEVVEYGNPLSPHVKN